MFRLQANLICFSNHIWKTECPHCYVGVIRWDFVCGHNQHVRHYVRWGRGCPTGGHEKWRFITSFSYQSRGEVAEQTVYSWTVVLTRFLLSGLDAVVVCVTLWVTQKMLSDPIWAARASGLRCICRNQFCISNQHQMWLIWFAKSHFMCLFAVRTS